LQNVTSAQTLNFARDVNISDNLSFTKTTNSLINITNPADIFWWGNIWTARNNVASGVRQTTFASIVIDWIEQTTWRHWNYSRWNQWSADTFAMGFHPAWVFTTSWAWGTLEINTTPLPGGGGGGTDRTQPGTVGFFALNLDTLISPELNQSAYRFFDNNNNVDVGSALANQDTSITLSNDGDAFRLRSLISITQNKLRQNEKTFKLQFAQQSWVCDSGFIWETYNDVTTTTAIAFNNNITPSDEDILISNINDPVNTGITAINQTYQELNNFSTSISEIPEDQDWKWDFSLIDNTAPNNTSYCFRIVESDGTLLDSYSVIPEITTYIPPSPGWVSTGLNLWLKSNAGTSTTTDGVNLASWTDQSGNGKTATAVTAPIYRDNATDNVNFYPVVNFNGTNQAMENTTWWMSSKSYFAVIIPTDTIDGTLSGGVPFGLECTNATVDFGTCGLPFGGLVLWSFTVAIPDEVITHALGSSANYRSAETGAESYAADKPMLVMINEDATGTIANIYEKWERLDNFTFNSYQSVTNTNYSLWRSLDGANPFYYDWDVVEIINFDDRLVDADRIKIESYLSLKYGITLKDWTQDYIASDGSTIIWDSGIAWTYNNDIFGIWRDNVQSLEQVQATSINDGTILTITAVWEGTNMSPSFVDIIDKEFFTIWNNAWANTWSATDTPAWFNVIARKWQTQENGDTGSTTFEFDVDDTNFDIPVLTAGTNYYFVYDSDGDSTLADETPVSMTNTSGSLWSTNLNLADETVFTIASEASSNNIPTDITLSNNTINENSIANTVVWSLTTTDGDVSDTHTYSLAIWTGDDDNARFTISWSNLEINHSPDHEIQDSYSIRIQTDDGNGWQYQEIFNIIINDLGEANTTTIDLEDSEDDFKYSVTSGQWNNNAVNPFAGSNSLESDNLWADNTQSCFEVDHNSSSTGSIDFYYEVSSQAWSDELRFFIDNVQQDQWSGTVTYTQYTSGDVSAGPHNYKWCYVKDGGWSAGTDNAYIDNINFIGTATDIIDPTIDSTNFASGSLLPGWNQTINLTYNDTDSWINVASANITLHKWDWISAYWADISGTGLTSGIINSTSATYTTNNLDFGKYQYRFSISDNAGNTQNQNIDFYIDVPEFIISTPEIDMWTLDSISNNFSPTVTITVRTVGAWFDIFMDADDSLLYTSESIDNWNGSTWFGYDQDPYTGNISAIGINQNISTQAASLNTNGDRNIYTFNIQLGGLVSDEQAAWDYLWDIDFWINLAY
jgi:hypothetical protein